MGSTRDDEVIRVKGARGNNLANINVEFIDGLTAVTGVSGSGKSTLVFDTLYHEARRRFAEIFASPSIAHQYAPAAVDEISGLRPSVAIAQNQLNRNPNSTVATAAGIHPFLRLLFARFGTRKCHRCTAPVSTSSETDVVTYLHDASKRSPVEVLAVVASALDGPNTSLLHYLTEAFDTSDVLVDGRAQIGDLDPEVPHEISILLERAVESLTRNQARALYQRARDIGAQHLRVAGTLFALTEICSRCGGWTQAPEPTHFHTPCPACDGAGCNQCRATGLHPIALAVSFDGDDLPALMRNDIGTLGDRLNHVQWPASAKRLHAELRRRLDALSAVGLDYVALDRPTPSLSRGESQRLRIAVASTSTLEDLLHVLDEPTVGLHPADVDRVMGVLHALPGPAIVVEHDRNAVAHAKDVIDIGPGAGSAGGHVVFQGTPAALWRADTPTGRAFSLRDAVELPSARGPSDRYLEVAAASRHNLDDIDVRFALQRLNVVTGVSGSGKSSLVGVVVESLKEDEPRGCREIVGFDGDVVLVDQNPIGKNPRSNPATYTKLADIVRDTFAHGSDLSASHFSFNRPEGACPECEGVGAREMKMRYLRSAWIECDACAGTRFSDEVRARRVAFGDAQFDITEFLALSVDQSYALFEHAEGLSDARKRSALAVLDALRQIGLGYLRLGQPSTTLSGGEAQRVKLARHLGTRSLSNKLVVLDEPTTGLHPADVAGLLGVIDALVARGATMILVEHNLDVVRAADWVVDLGPGAGPNGGRIVHVGTAGSLSSVSNSATGRALVEETRLKPATRRSRLTRTRAGRTKPEPPIQIRGAAANNLRDVDVDIPQNALTVVTGVSGSGKSSLVHDVLGSEAKRRYLESLSVYERQGVKEGAAGNVRAIKGLRVSIPLSSDAQLRNPRWNVGLTSHISPNLAAVMARLGDKPDLDRHYEPRHFLPNIYGSACTTCHGVGTLREPVIDKLIVKPDLPLCAGAMYSPGFFPQGFFGKPFNSGYDILQEIASRFDFDPFETPWNEMSEAARDAFLYGLPDPMEVTYRSRKGRTTTRTTKFPGLFAGFIRDWDAGGTYTNEVICAACHGGRLRPQYLAVSLNGQTMQTLTEMPLVNLLEQLRGIADTLSKAPARERKLVAKPLTNATNDVKRLVDLNLGYLNLVRQTNSLSAGEAQRLQLARALAGGLSGLTLLLDEPSRGMHPVEVDALIRALKDVTAVGNTTVVVEHDLQVIAAADHLIDIGPGPGVSGGRIVAEGSVAEVRQSTSTTAQWLRAKSRPSSTRPPSPHSPPHERRQPHDWMTLFGAQENNLKHVDAAFPLGLLVGVCGVSGSGKSSLIIDTLARIVAPKKYTTSTAREKIDPGLYERIDGAPERCILLDQSRQGIQSPASFLGCKKTLEQLYAASAEARTAGLESVFSGRCDGCGGRGTVRIDMGFLPNVHDVCEACSGSGYLTETWDVVLRGHALPDLMARTIDEIADLWSDITQIQLTLDDARALGLGYLVAQQPARQISGGEIQRLRIARELGKGRTRASSFGGLYLLDEPTIGQHAHDIARLAGILNHLVDQHATVIVVDHNTQLLAACDWLIELGPVGGPAGGEIIFAGTPEALASGSTPTAPSIRAML